MTRVVDVEDARSWLLAQRGRYVSKGRTGVVAVLPDAAEIDATQDEWAAWFTSTAFACFVAAGDGPVAFVQTDRRVDGRWISKPTMIDRAAADAPVPRTLTLHTIIMRRQPGQMDLKRPTYSHLLAYGGKPGNRAPDIIAGGRPIWRNGVGVEAAYAVADWMAQQDVDRVLNPCCGHGTLLAAIEQRGVDVYGCDVDPERADIARTLTIPDHKDLTR